MAVRVRLRIESANHEVLESIALIKTGFETEKPELLLPVKAAEKLGLWPSLPPEARVEIYDTAGGPMRVYVIPRGAKVAILAGDRESREVATDVVVLHTEVEILVGDKLAGELQVVIEDPGEGCGGLGTTPRTRRGRAKKPERWI